MSFKSPTEAPEHISLLDGHHSVLLAVCTAQRPLCSAQAASSRSAGGLFELDFDPGGGVNPL